MRSARPAIHACLTLALAGCAEEPTDWEDLDRTDRIAFMEDEVLPRMTAIFTDHDPQRFASFACESCHGIDMIEADYEMPHALPALPLDDTLEVAMARNPEMTALMLNDVFPVMVELLGGEKYNEQTAPNGLRCTMCHLVAP